MEATLLHQVQRAVRVNVFYQRVITKLILFLEKEQEITQIVNWSFNAAKWRRRRRRRRKERKEGKEERGGGGVWQFIRYYSDSSPVSNFAKFVVTWL